jgi:hypothetical protein
MGNRLPVKYGFLLSCILPLSGVDHCWSRSLTRVVLAEPLIRIKDMVPQSSLSILPCSSHDIPQLTPVYLAAFTDALSHAIFPRNNPSTADWWTNMNANEFFHPCALYVKVIDTVSSSSLANPVVAYGKWNLAIADEGDLTIEGGCTGDMPVWPEGGNKELADVFFGELVMRRKEIMGNREHYYLEILATLPAHQSGRAIYFRAQAHLLSWLGRGAGGKILQWGCDRADEACLECYLEAGPGLVGLYQKYGFRVVGQFTLPRIGHVESFMVRKPVVRIMSGRS